MPKDAMLDLETMSTEPNAAIVAIGCCMFDEHGVHGKLYTPVSLESCKEVGLHCSLSTIDWWSKQTALARAAWDVEDAPSVIEALTKLTRWLEPLAHRKYLRMWGNGATFDNVILTSAHRALGVDPPWMYYNDMCYRTMKNLFEFPWPRVGTHHHALDDAVHQANHLVAINRHFNLNLLKA